MSPPPAVQADLGPQFESDVNQLLALLQEGRASVGDIPVDIAERLRERMHMEEERRRLLIARRGRDVCWTDEDEDEPLVTIRIPTFNRGQRCLDTAISAALSQTYERVEVLLIGDGCDEEVASVYRTVKDDRFQFINLAERGVYPNDPWLRWLVAGAPPCNVAVTLAKGSWIAPCDDDDEFTPDHVEVLLREARRRRLEMVWSKSEMETPEGWEVVGKEPLGPGAGTHGSIFYSAGLRFLQWSDTSWKMNEPADGNFLRRLTAIGVRTGFVDHVTYRHYLEGRYRMNITGPQSMS
jgi:glycosyltransferase involved in cell wall biosynthesis